MAPQLGSSRSGIYGWNDAIRSEFNASEAFDFTTSLLLRESVDHFRNLGVSSALSFRPDGIARGTGALLLLSNLPEQERVARLQGGCFLLL